MRILIAGILGGVAMYIWASAAHLSPLATVGAHPVPNQGLVTAGLQLSLGDKGGVYIFGAAPAAKGSAAGPAGMIAYDPHGAAAGPQPRQLVTELVLELVEAVLLAFALAAVAGFGRRVGIAVLVGLIAAITTNASYWNWYGFGLDYTLANGFIELVKYVVAGVVAAAVMGRRAAG
ncbi:MAG TPA: hypothetical protein VGG29_10360 [Caulobacteraceae bacterium]|jgi:hypothetical protein